MEAGVPLHAVALTRWLLGDGPPPDPKVIRTAKLAPYAYTALPRSHPGRGAFRADYAAALARHQRIKDEVRPLLASWNDAGIGVLLFKGFHLAEFVDPIPGARFHGDVDLLLRPAQAALAERIAVGMGWYAARPPTWRTRPSHNAFCLARTGGAAQVDVHTQVVHVALPWHAPQRRITAAVWERSSARDWAGITIRELAPPDMLLVGVVLQRCWSADGWRPKPQDVVDFQRVTSRFGVARDQLFARARQLHCERTLGAFLERCDPENGRFNVAPISSRQRRRLERRAFRERGPLGAVELALARLGGAAPSAALALRFVPTVLGVRRALGRHADVQSLLNALALGAPSHRSRFAPPPSRATRSSLASTGRHASWDQDASVLASCARSRHTSRSGVRDARSTS